jgi:phospholipase/carboxylesterase
VSDLNTILSQAITIQEPQQSAAGQLFMLHHGVGSDAQAMVFVGEHLARHFPQAHVVSIQAPHSCDLGRGAQWFSVQGVTEDNRGERVNEQMPLFLATVAAWQNKTGIGAGATALVGFSQGGIMSLESTQQQHLVAARVVALSARFVALPHVPPVGTTLHMIHGKKDAVIHYGFCVKAAEHLVEDGADLTADVLPDLSHEITEEVLNLMTQRLKEHIPAEVWRQAHAQAQSMNAELKS